MTNGRKNSSGGKKITRYTYEDIKEPGTPETGHTSLLSEEEQVIRLPLDNGWTKAVEIGRLPTDVEHTIVVDMDPLVDPVLLWAGKRSRRDIPILPLQRNEIVSESRIAQVVTRARRAASESEPRPEQLALFADLEKSLRETEKDRRVEFYTHDEGWKNKLICGDSLLTMESLQRYEGLHGRVQMIYLDPPYGIKYNSNFQQRVDTAENDERDQADDVLTIKAFRDTWTLGVHSYLSYLHERLYLCRELLSETGSIFIQISEDNVHLIRQLLDEVFGRSNSINTIVYQKTALTSDESLGTIFDYILWYAKDKELAIKRFHRLYRAKVREELAETSYGCLEAPDGSTWRRMTAEEKRGLKPLPEGWRIFDLSDPTSSHYSLSEPIQLNGKMYTSGHRFWSTSTAGMRRLAEKNRLVPIGDRLRYKRYLDDFPVRSLTNIWTDTTTGTFTGEKLYVVQTNPKVVERCILMTTEPGDLVLDPTCGSGTTAFCAEKLGRRWITCDISRVAINVARNRLLSSVFDLYKTRNGQVSSGFVYKTTDRITLESLANDLEPEKIELIDQPELDQGALRVVGPFEVMTLGRYSVEDWKGYFTESGKLENYIEVICHLYRKDSALQAASGLIHAIAESESEKVAISVGPLTGRVTAKQINDAVQDALALGIIHVHVLGWAFEANVGEIKSQLESRGKIKVQLIMIRPDTLAEGLEGTQPGDLFSPLALPDVEISIVDSKRSGKEAIISLSGVGIFDRKRRITSYYPADSGYIAAWYLDEDYDGDCFVDCQMFFDFGKIPNLKAAIRAEVDPEEFSLQLTSQPFPVRGYKRIAVKVVDVYGNESTVVKDLA